MISKLIDTTVDITEKEVEVYARIMCSNDAKLKNHPEKVGYDEIYNIYMNSLIK